jgi:tetratricopeptide (TPR) repeat protein
VTDGPTLPGGTEPPDRIRTALLFLLPATALAAFPFFSNFTAPKLIVAGSLLGAILVACPRRAWPWPRREASLPPDRSAADPAKRGDPGPAARTLPDPGVLLLVAYLVLSIPSYLRALGGHDALTQLVLDLTFAAAYLLARTTALQSGLPVFISVAGLLVLAYRLAEALLPAPLLGISVLTGSSTLGNPDFVAELSAVSLLCALGLAGQVFPGSGPVPSPGACARRSNLALLALSLVTFFASAAALVLIPSVTARVAALAGMVILATVAAGRRMRSRSSVAAVAAAAAALAVGGVLALAGSGLLDDRLYLYRLGLDCARDAPLLGQGAGGFVAAFMVQQGQYLEAHREAAGLWTNATHAHNEVLQIWVERGLLPLLAAAGFVAWHFVRGRRAPAVLPASIACILVLSCGSVTLTVVPLRLALALLLGALIHPIEDPAEARPDGSKEAGTEGRTNRGHPPRAHGRLPSLLLRAAGIALVITPIWMGVADVLFVRGDLDAARTLYPLNPRVDFYAGTQRMQARDLDAACPMLAEAASRYPNLSVLLAAGNCAYRKHEYDNAEELYRRAIAFKPTYSLGHANLALALNAQGQRQAAYRHVQRAVSLAPGNPRVRSIRSAVCVKNPYCPARP